MSSSPSKSLFQSLSGTHKASKFAQELVNGAVVKDSVSTGLSAAFAIGGGALAAVMAMELSRGAPLASVVGVSIAAGLGVLAVGAKNTFDDAKALGISLGDLREQRRISHAQPAVDNSPQAPKI